jgi:hypothetical protein
MDDHPKFAVLNRLGTKVHNIILAEKLEDARSVTPADLHVIQVDETVAIGDLWDAETETFSKPTVVVEESSEEETEA